MTLSPKARANIVSFAVMVPFLVLLNVYRNELSFRTHIYLSLLLFVGTMLIYMWVHSRASARLPGRPYPVAELNLAEERLPGMVWLAVFPPLLVLADLWWVTTHSDVLPWRQGAPAASRQSSSYRFFVGGAIFWNSVAAWMVLFGLAVWHGMSRAYQFRRAQLQAGIANQWAALVGVNASLFGTALAVPESRMWVLFIPMLAGFGVMAWNAWRLNRLYATLPRIGTWFYRDPSDPTFFGPRGVNFANGWSWILVAAIIPPILLAEWMLNRAPQQGTQTSAINLSSAWIFQDTRSAPRIVSDIAASKDAGDLPRLLPPDTSGTSAAQNEAVTQAVLKAYPHLTQMPGEGLEVVDIALRPDGSVYRSRIQYVTPENRYPIMSDPSAVLPQRAEDIAGVIFHKGGPVGKSQFRDSLWIRYVLLHDEPDSSRDPKHVHDAVLAAHSDLLLPLDGRRINRMTVYMSGDGKVDRHFVELRRRSDMHPYGDQVPEVFGQQFEALGLRLDQLGPMGVLHIYAPPDAKAGSDSKQGWMVVRYAWPRRVDEPVGGIPLKQRRPRIAPFTHAEASTVIEHFLPGALNAKGKTSKGTPWLVISPTGEVLRSGYVKIDPDQPAEANLFEANHPDKEIGWVVESLVVRKYAEKFSRRVIFAWLEPGEE